METSIQNNYMLMERVIMHVFNSSFWLIHNFDNNLYYNPLTVNHLFIFIMSRVVDENKVQLDLKKVVSDGVSIERWLKSTAWLSKENYKM